MIRLAIDSSSISASVAILEDEKILCELFLNAGLTHSQTLLPMVQQAFSLLPNKKIDSIALTVGPGSFTGVRIAVAAAKGLAFTDNLPCIPVSAMEALAYNCREMQGSYTICALSDARCKRAYYALFSLENGTITRISEDDCSELEIINDKLKDFENVLLVGDGAKMFAKEYSEYCVATESQLLIKGSSVAFASLSKEEISAESLQPLYLQLPQAQRERLEKLKG